jgi:NADH dehydrogenase
MTSPSTRSAALGAVLRDVLLTREEYADMADGLADSDGPSTGSTSLSEWIARHGRELGRSYANELTRRYRLIATRHITVIV